MFKNYLKIALRQLRKQKFYSAIKIGGFALGIATCLLMTLYIRHETDFDRFKARRAKFVESLKSAAGRQCHGQLTDGDRVCFVGLGDEICDGGA